MVGDIFSNCSLCNHDFDKPRIQTFRSFLNDSSLASGGVLQHLFTRWSLIIRLSSTRYAFLSTTMDLSLPWNTWPTLLFSLLKCWVYMPLSCPILRLRLDWGVSIIRWSWLPIKQYGHNQPNRSTTCVGASRNIIDNWILQNSRYIVFMMFI